MENSTDKIPQTIYWVCQTTTTIITLQFEGFFIGLSFDNKLLEYVGPAISRLIFIEEIDGPSLTFFTDEIKAKRRLKDNLQMAIKVIDGELQKHHEDLILKFQSPEIGQWV